MHTIPTIEPWLRGTHSDTEAVGRAVVHALELALEDLQKWTEGLADAEVHSEPLGLTPVAYHLKHISRSADRLLSYAEGKQLTVEQLGRLKAETEGRETLAELTAEAGAGLRDAIRRVQELAATDLNAARGVGRKQLPTSVGGLIVHTAEHTARHVGQVVTTAKVLRGMRG